MTYNELKDDLDALNIKHRKNVKPLKISFRWLKNDIIILNAIYTKNVEIMERYCKKELHVRHIIKCLKNEPDHLDFFLQYVEDPGAGSYFFTKIKDNRTFDIYNKYILPWNLRKDCVTQEQWEYIKKIGYIDTIEAQQLEQKNIETGG